LLNRFNKEEAEIKAWEDLQVAKAEAEMEKIKVGILLGYLVVFVRFEIISLGCMRFESVRTTSFKHTGYPT
jgi:hypothetical protein